MFFLWRICKKVRQIWVVQQSCGPQNLFRAYQLSVGQIFFEMCAPPHHFLLAQDLIKFPHISSKVFRGLFFFGIWPGLRIHFLYFFIGLCKKVPQSCQQTGSFFAPIDLSVVVQSKPPQSITKLLNAQSWRRRKVRPKVGPSANSKTDALISRSTHYSLTHAL